MSDPLPPPPGSSGDPPQRAPLIRQYDDGELTLRIRDLPGQGRINVHIEHRSGAALIAPFCESVRAGRVIEIKTTGFDGIDYRVTIEDAESAPATIEASRPTMILGGASRCVLPRKADAHPSHPIRATGDEDTVPISMLKRDKR